MDNHKGITLLEVILTVTILSIVLTTFLFLFPQISLFNKKTDEALSGINLAKEKIVLLENLVRDDRLNSDTDKIFKISNDTLNITRTNKDFPKYKLLNLTENIEETNDFYILTTSDIHLNTTISIHRTPEYNGVYQLFIVYVEVNDPNLNEVTTLYGYLSISN